MNSLFRFCCRAFILSVISAIVLGFFGHIHPAIDTFSHFRLHLAVGLLFASLCLLVLSMKRFALIALLAGVVGVYASASGTVFTARDLSADPNLPVYKLFHFNLLRYNVEKAKVLKEVQRIDPDIMSVTEQSENWRARFAEIDANWPYKFQCRKAGQINATSIYSKWPIIPGSKFCGVYASLARVDIEAPNGSPFTFAATHFRWPWPASGPRQLEELIPHIQTFGNDAIASGDFNAVTWSWALKKFAKAGGLEIVNGIGPTWMIDIARLGNFFWAGLPIDNVLQKGAVKILSAKRLEKMGSDHLPVLVRFQLSK